MRNDTVDLKDTLRRLTLFLGVAQVTLGCVIGLLPPTAVPWFRGIVMAHIEYTGNGVLLIALGLLVPELRLGRVALWLWFVALQFGTWLNGSAALLAGLSGQSSHLFSTANVMVTAVAVLLGLELTLAGLVQAWRARARSDGAAAAGSRSVAH